MALVTCKSGRHVYDTNQHSSCPYCRENNTSIDLTDNNSIGKTVMGNPYGQQQPAFNGEVEDPGATIAPQQYLDQIEDVDKTIVLDDSKQEATLVVGWLVCIEGPNKCKTYEIGSKNNTIGRDKSNDIAIEGDNRIAKMIEARLAYDNERNDFHLIPANNTNNIRVNNSAIYQPVILHAYDLIKFGESKMVFIPFCGEHFTWENGLTTEAVNANQ